MELLEITTKAKCSKCGTIVTVVDAVSMRNIEKKKIEIPMPEKCPCYSKAFEIIEIKTALKPMSK